MDKPTPFAQEIHYQWLEQGGSESELSPAQAISVPVFDFRTICSEATASAMIKSLQECGVILLNNHSVTKKQRMLELSAEFFAQPDNAKNALRKTPVPGAALISKRSPSPVRHAKDEVPKKETVKRSPSPVRFFKSNTTASPDVQPVFAPPPPIIYTKAAIGYGEMRHERLNPIMKPDVKETFDFAIVVEDGKSHLGENSLPKIRDFDAVATTYLNENHHVGKHVLHAIAVGLGLSENAFDGAFDKPLAIQRLIRYPAQPVGETKEIGAGAHVDYGGVTVLSQDSDGLEIFYKGKWRQVHVPAECVCINIGFMLEKLAGGRIKATQHRVVNRNNSVRYSTAFFLDPNPAAVIEPKLQPLPEESSKYKSCVSGHKGVRYSVGYQTKMGTR